ncbi:MAG: fibronectin type III domain-containing protein [Bacillota bacterium]|nr:fibronectin type III domain-containing protein [Bacillota bacterium]
MTCKKLLAVIAAIAIAVTYTPLCGTAAFGETVDPSSYDADTLRQMIEEAKAEVQAKEAALHQAQANLETAQSTYDNIGKSYLSANAGAGISVDGLTAICRGNTTVKEYVTTKQYKKFVDSAVTVKNLNKDADFVTECNRLRAKHGLDPLTINYRLMCFSVVSAGVASQSYDHTIFNQMDEDLELGDDMPYGAENLAWGYDDLFDGWYTAEKKLFDKYVASGKYPGLAEMSSFEIYKNYRDVYYDTGHYLNIIDEDHTMTGFARGVVSDTIDEQSFSWEDEEGEYGKNVTPAQFKSELAAFASSAKDELDAAKSAVAQAQQQLTEAQAVYEELVDATRISIEAAEVTGLDDVVYTGKAIKPAVTVILEGNQLAGADYTVSYKNNTKVGSAKVTISGQGEYKGTISRSFKIIPKGTKIYKLSKGKKKMKVKWKKQAVQTTGYQIQYSPDEQLQMDVKSVTVKKARTTSKTIKKLKSKTYYYVRIRTYKTVSGEKYYSQWSAVKKVKIK